MRQDLRPSWRAAGPAATCGRFGVPQDLLPSVSVVQDLWPSWRAAGPAATYSRPPVAPIGMQPPHRHLNNN
ncbi:Hypothetical protein NTJ_00074 [Nesidiocoris tenuis]|uniref:Uncharacterized protein n=1 Tax=Nesidiocoris tenuis TaxID=355587 RepID=A0ABN7A819_9HEMI|nr:Hypothetical protein NTJ_00074 [Nesidiocoris tenuis]